MTSSYPPKIRRHCKFSMFHSATRQIFWAAVWKRHSFSGRTWLIVNLFRLPSLIAKLNTWEKINQNPNGVSRFSLMSNCPWYISYRDSLPPFPAQLIGHNLGSQPCKYSFFKFLEIRCNDNQGCIFFILFLYSYL